MPPLGGPSPMTPGGPMPPGISMPKSPFGGPTGPGTSPALSPGQGAGHEAAATADIKAVIHTLRKAIPAFPVGDKRGQALMQSILRLEANFGKSADDDLTPAATQRISASAKPGGGMPGSMAPPGMTLGGPSPMGGSAGPMGGAPPPSMGGM